MQSGYHFSFYLGNPLVNYLLWLQHVSSTSVSLCMASIKRAYFGDGTLPNQENLCETDRGHFFDDRESSASSIGAMQVLDDMTRLAEFIGPLTFVMAALPL